MTSIFVYEIFYRSQIYTLLFYVYRAGQRDMKKLTKLNSCFKSTVAKRYKNLPHSNHLIKSNTMSLGTSSITPARESCTFSYSTFNAVALDLWPRFIPAWNNANRGSLFNYLNVSCNMPRRRMPRWFCRAPKQVSKRAPILLCFKSSYRFTNAAWQFNRAQSPCIIIITDIFSYK